jgi:hypothetical protein
VTRRRRRRRPPKLSQVSRSTPSNLRYSLPRRYLHLRTKKYWCL